ncbi:MAG: tetratricopeptide repeat protein, partial [Saprospiraceae bacterium]|nr:tetratricopeptide repeat protein [Saprospiraceae bacterium]
RSGQSDSVLTYMLLYNRFKNSCSGTERLSELSKIGRLYGKLNDFHGALEYYLRSLEMNKQETEQQKVQHDITILNIAGIYKKLKNYKKAEEYLQIILYNKKNTVTRIDKIQAYLEMGIVCLERGDTLRAVESLKKGLKLNEK